LGSQRCRAAGRSPARLAGSASRRAESVNCHIKPRIEGLLQIGRPAVALSALAFFLRLPRAALRAETRPADGLLVWSIRKEPRSDSTLKGVLYRDSWRQARS
jgi:hypothetical protein